MEGSLNQHYLYTLGRGFLLLLVVWVAGVVTDRLNSSLFSEASVLIVCGVGLSTAHLHRERRGHPRLSGYASAPPPGLSGRARASPGAGRDLTGSVAWHLVRCQWAGKVCGARAGRAVTSGVGLSDSDTDRSQTDCTGPPARDNNTRACGCSRLHFK